MLYPQYLTRVSGPASSQSSSLSRTLDYSGLEDQAKRLDMLPQVQSQKFAALYDGDIPGSVAAGHRIRDLLDSINNPRTPLVRVAHESTSSDSDARGPVVEGEAMQFPIANDGKAGGVAKGNAPKPAAPPAPPVTRRPLPAGRQWPNYPMTVGQQQEATDLMLRQAGWNPNAPLPVSRKPSSIGPSPYAITEDDNNEAQDRLARLAGFGK